MPSINIRAGQLRHRIEIQEQMTGKRGADGSVIRTPWTTVGVRSARVEPVTGGESYRSAQVDSRITHKITMRYMKELNSSHRIIHRERTLHIVSVRDLDDRRRHMVVMAMENTGTAKT